MFRSLGMGMNSLFGYTEDHGKSLHPPTTTTLTRPRCHSLALTRRGELISFSWTMTEQPAQDRIRGETCIAHVLTLAVTTTMPIWTVCVQAATIGTIDFTGRKNGRTNTGVDPDTTKHENYTYSGASEHKRAEPR